MREDSKCPLCGGKTENLKHFLLYSSEFLKLQQAYEEDKERIIASVIFDFENKKEESETRDHT